MNAAKNFDVVVIDGGPAGTTAATLLQRHGHRCAVIEASAFPRYHIGESLIPHTYRTLDRLGLLPKLRASAFATPLMAGVGVIHAFYTLGFSFKAFVVRFPEQRSTLIDCLVGDVLGKEMSGYVAALYEMVPPAVPL